MMKTENEKLREVLRCIADLPMDRCSTENDYRLSAAKAIALGALSQQVEPAPAQDEREAVERFSPTTSVPHCGRASEVEAYMTEDDDGEYMTVAQHKRIVAALTRPAQAEQQPVGHQFQDREGVWKQFMSERHYEDTLADGTWPIRAIYAAPIAQTEQQQPVAWRRVVERLIANVEIFDGRPRPMCRDCADRNGICESGLDCDIRALVKEARAMIAAPIAQTAPQPEQSGLVEATSAGSRGGMSEEFVEHAKVEAIANWNRRAQPAEAEGVEMQLRKVIDELKAGFVVCQQCGDQEDTATLDCVPELEAIADALSAERTRADVAVADANDAERALAAVTAERDKINADRKACWEEFKALVKSSCEKERCLQEEIDHLRAEVEGMRKDAERWRWVRNNCWEIIDNRSRIISLPKDDSHIDAAMGDDDAN